ncbi:MAG: hypothetical protein JW746_05785 [Candidatus Krumholzibacteriota bacterium]|nr:hypothetical protein [Candidatus Krumholzibacteriota bacterium]
MIWFFSRFIGASLLLSLIHIKAGFIYMRIIFWGAKPLLSVFGYSILAEKSDTISAAVSLNPVIFLSLVIALSGIPVREKIIPAVTGTAILTAANIITVFLSFLSYYKNNEILWTITEFLNLTANFFLPLLLFMVLLPVKRLIFNDPSAV